MNRGQIAIVQVLTWGLVVGVAVIGASFGRISMTNNEVKTLSNEQQQIVQRITVVETESKQYRSDISEIKEDIKAIRKGLGIK